MHRTWASKSLIYNSKEGLYMINGSQYVNKRLASYIQKSWYCSYLYIHAGSYRHSLTHSLIAMPCSIGCMIVHSVGRLIWTSLMFPCTSWLDGGVNCMDMRLTIYMHVCRKYSYSLVIDRFKLNKRVSSIWDGSQFILRARGLQYS